jgi:mannose-6-phosphate isomerase-like protein (cupin superfamily)
MTIAVTPDSPETFDAAGCRFTVLEDGSATAGRIGAVLCDLVPGWGGPPQHLHREHDETFFVVSGAIQFTSGTDTLIARPGQLVTAPIGSPHTFANADSQAPASLVCTVTPERYIGYFRELSGLAPGADGRMDPHKVLEIMSRYATDPFRPQS